MLNDMLDNNEDNLIDSIQEQEIQTKKQIDIQTEKQNMNQVERQIEKRAERQVEERFEKKIEKKIEKKSFDSVNAFIYAIMNYLILKSDPDFNDNNIIPEVKFTISVLPPTFICLSLEEEDINEESLHQYIADNKDNIDKIKRLINKAEAILGLPKDSLKDKLRFISDRETSSYQPIFKPIIDQPMGSLVDNAYMSQSSKVDLKVFGQKLLECFNILCINDKTQYFEKNKSNYLISITNQVINRAKQAKDYFWQQQMTEQQNDVLKQVNKNKRQDYFIRRKSSKGKMKSVYW